MDLLLEAIEEDELGALVKKLSPFSLRCSGSSSLTLASSMSAVMAAMRASVCCQQKNQQKSGHQINENNSKGVCVCVCVRVGWEGGQQTGPSAHAGICHTYLTKCVTCRGGVVGEVGWEGW